jgi:predicted MPP superfamily phosphohydrolase
MTKRRKKRSLLWTPASLIVLTAILLMDSTYRLALDSVELRFENLPDSFNGFRIVQLSDLHGAKFGKDNTRLLRAVAKAEPDLIALTGDFIDSPADLEAFSALAERLALLAPVYFVSGNHDWSSGAIRDLSEVLRNIRVRYLQNEYVTLSRNGESIILCGVEDPNGRADMARPDTLTEEIAAAQPGAFVLLLAHRNYWVSRYPALPVARILCGHAHGGIVRLPFLGGILGTGGELFPKYCSGIFSSGRYQMFVSRGLGDSLFPFRFLNNPQVAVLTLKKM